MTPTALRPPAWTARAACQGMASRDADPWHPPGPDEAAPAVRARLSQQARMICLACPVQIECTRHALVLIETEGDVEGIWGGMPAARLRALARRLARSSRKLPQHGTRACYVRGCRRPECRAANARDEAQRRLRAS